MREFFVRLSQMDRRWIFLGVAVFAVVPFFLPADRAIRPTRYTELVFEEIEKVRPAEEPDSKPVLVSMDYDPGTLAELDPMARAVLRHIFARRGKVIALSFVPTGTLLARQALDAVAAEFADQGVEEGVHYAFLGFNQPFAAVVQSIGRDIRDNYPKDSRGVPLDEMELFKGYRNYDDTQIVLGLSGTSLAAAWIGNAVERFGANFAMGVTNVMAADMTPFIPDQSKGLIGGMRGAAEYEALLERHYGITTGSDAIRGMGSQSWTHVFILALIVLGNVGYFLGRRKGGVQ